MGEDHLDHMGIANLRVPLDVGEARECSDNSGEKATAIGALHPCAGRDAAIAFTPTAAARVVPFRQAHARTYALPPYDTWACVRARMPSLAGATIGG